MTALPDEPPAYNAQTPAAPADHPNAGNAPLDGAAGSPGGRSDPAPPHEGSSSNLPENTPGHASSLPDTEQAQAEAARTGADPFLDTEQTPALPPRPASPTDDAMAATAGVAAPAPATTTATAAEAHPGVHEGVEEEHVSPQVASLRAMFPDFDVAVLQSVLDSVNGDQERALDILLGMSDPEYVSTQTTQQPEPSSLDLDEQLARQLMLEDQQQQQRHATGNSWPRRDQPDVPYQTRLAPEGQIRPPPPEGGVGRTDLQEIQRTMGQIAESGKRTFSSIVSKVKAKINEYEATRNTGQGSTSAATPPQWGAAPPANLDRHTASQAYQQRYYGNEPSPVVEQPISLNGPSGAHGQVQGYSLDPPPTHPSTRSPVASPTPTPAPGPTTPPPAAHRSPAASPRPSGDVPRPPTTVSGSPVNAAKIGLLPKRPVSLLNTNSPPATRPSDDDDELEYVENPFDDNRK